MADIVQIWSQRSASGPIPGLFILGFAVLAVLALRRFVPISSTKVVDIAHHGTDEKVDRNNPLNVFPPSRRAALAKLLPVSRLGTADLTIPLETLRKSQIPTAQVQPLDRNGLFTSTSILTQEIRALGRFPDYSVLSGVPHPQPAPSFDINKATFRPFRPFRWNYHQTMGAFSPRIIFLALRARANSRHQPS